jgi:dTDP-L-rhamnose 4-epimerase
MRHQVLVTGGAGFIGSHLVDELIAEGHRVRVLDSLDPEAHPAMPDHLNPGADYVWSPIQDEAVVEGLVRGATAVSHHAAKVGLGVDFDDVTDYVHHNDVGTATLLRMLHRAGFTGRLVLASSMVVYGEGGYRCGVHGPVRPGPRSESDMRRGMFEPRCPTCGRPLEPAAVREDAPTEPRNVYAATKLHQEHLCVAFGREARVPVAVLRYHNVYGPRMPLHTPYAGVASLFRAALQRGEAPRVNEDGRQLRDFVHVRDVARANVLALTAGIPVAGTFNVASGRPRTVGEMAVALAAAFGPDAPAPEITGRYRLGDVRHVFASSDLAAATLGFRAQVAFDEGIAEVANQAGRTQPVARAVTA